MTLKEKLMGLVIALVLSLGVASTSHAVLVDLDGAGGLAPIDVQQFDWGTTSFAAINGGTAFTNFIGSGGACPGTSCNFDVLTHARLTGVTPVGGSEFSPTGLNSTFEITMIARFTEAVTAPTTAGQASFRTVTTAPAILEIYFDSTPNAVDVSGSGFNDGRLILTGSTIADAQGNFTVTSLTPVLLDQAATNDYGPTNAPGAPGALDQATVSGFGGQGNIAFDSLVTDPTFFLEALAQFGVIFQNISQGLAFFSVNPSDCYTNTAAGVGVGTTIAERQCAPTHIDGLMSLNNPDALGGVVPNIGPVNGAFGAAGGPDFIAQTDYNSSLLPAAVPEPTSLLLLGIGLIGVAVYSRRKIVKK
jgi:hypothetical protein